LSLVELIFLKHKQGLGGGLAHSSQTVGSDWENELSRAPMDLTNLKNKPIPTLPYNSDEKTLIKKSLTNKIDLQFFAFFKKLKPN